MKQSRSVTRRQFLVGAGTLAGSAVLAACGATPTVTPAPVATKPAAAATAAPAAPAATQPPAVTFPTAVPTVAAAPTATKAAAAPASSYKEAPALAELVKAGKLPSVDKRLPEKPMVVTPVESIGIYGGSWKIFLDAVTRIGDPASFTGLSMLRWNRTQNGSEPAIAESWEVKQDGKEFVLHLRKGLKWSDGEPFTADDILFWWEDIIGNKELFPAGLAWMLSPTRTPAVVTKSDDYTLTYKFDEPHALFITLLTKTPSCYACKHYLKDFHTKYVAKDVLDKKVADAKLTNWVALFQNRWASNPETYGQSNPSLPSLWPWQNTVAPPAERFVFERNPYFYGVDTQGNQLALHRFGRRTCGAGGSYQSEDHRRRAKLPGVARSGLQGHAALHAVR